MRYLNPNTFYACITLNDQQVQSKERQLPKTTLAFIVQDCQIPNFYRYTYCYSISLDARLHQLCHCSLRSVSLADNRVYLTFLVSRSLFLSCYKLLTSIEAHTVDLSTCIHFGSNSELLRYIEISIEVHFTY